MKTVLSLSLAVLLCSCQSLTPLQTAPIAEQPPTEQSLPTEPEPVVAEPAAPQPLTISTDSDDLMAWVHYRAAILSRLNEERDALSNEADDNSVNQLKRMILQLHPDTPYLTRLRIQMQLTEQLQQLPSPLAELLSWDLAFNQKLLEAESAVSALTRLNAQQHDNIERLQKTNRELQKKIDALTQIEAQLNQPAAPVEDNNGF